MSNKKSQSGFTLIELLIVVLIIGILAAIAIPVFNGQRTKAKNSVAKSTLRNAMTAASSAFVANNDSYDGVSVLGTSTSLQAEESSISAVAGNLIGSSANDKAVKAFGVDVNGETDTAVSTGNVNGIVLCTASKGDTGYCARQRVVNGVPQAWRYAQRSGSNETINNVATDTFTTTPWK